MSDFRERLRSSAASSVPNVLTDPLETFSAEDDTAQLLVIPVSQEIASDFSLIGYDDTISRIEYVLTQRGKQRNILLYGENGVGKEHPYSLVVPTPIGDRLWGDLRVGDELFGRDGLPTKIVTRYEQGIKPIYRVTFDDETSTLVGLNHLWLVRGYKSHQKRETNEWETLSTAAIIERGITRPNGIHKTRVWELPVIEPIEYPFHEIPIDPYTLGVWIGDGSAASPRYSKPDIEIVDRIRKIYTVTENFGSDCPCWYISNITEGLKSIKLWECRSHERFVPVMCLQNSAAVRSEILRGLMDTDGFVNPNGSIQFSSSSRLLADNVAWLVRSLGGKAHQNVKSDCGYKDDNDVFIPCRDAYVVTISIPIHIFHLSRKRLAARTNVELRYLTRWIDKIEYDHDELAMCVQVEAQDALYLVNDFIPTHNTAIVHGLVQRKNRGDLSTHMFKRMFYRLNTSRLLHMDNVATINKQFDQALEEFGQYNVMVIENFYTLMTYLKIKGANAVMVGFLEALSRRKLQSIITCNTRERALIINEIPEIHEIFLSRKSSRTERRRIVGYSTWCSSFVRGTVQHRLTGFVSLHHSVSDTKIQKRYGRLVTTRSRIAVIGSCDCRIFRTNE